MHRFDISLSLLIIFAVGAHAGPLGWLRAASASVQADHGWLWGWAWGADSSVSVVDRTPPLTFISRPAAFGSELTDPLLGYVIPLNSFTAPCPDVEDANDFTHNSTSQDPTSNVGCPALCISGPNVPEAGESWIALVQRGKCQFADKAREAQRLGARAVVVGGDDPEISGNPDALVNMYSPGDASDVRIAATFIKYSDYTELSSLIATSNTSHSGLKTLSLLLNSEYSVWQWYSPILTFLTILVVPCCLTFLTLLVHRIRLVRAAQRDRAPEDIVKSLPWRVWTGTGWEKHSGVVPGQDAQRAPSQQDVDIELGESPAESVTPAHVVDDDDDPAWFQSQSECAICLEEFTKGDRVRVLPCKHIFHLDEVDAWLIHRKKLCPVCKADVTQPPPAIHSHTPSPLAENAPVAQPASPPIDSMPEATERTPLIQPNP